MKLPVSDKQSSFGLKPHIRKGYYPAKLISVEYYKDRDGNIKIGEYGKQLIFNFAIYKSDELGKPTEPLQYVSDAAQPALKRDVVIPNFVYYEYKKKDKDKKFIEGEFQTAITPNSAITRLLTALGWVFSAEKEVDPESFVGSWVEADIDDYKTKGKDDEEIISSSIKDINVYDGPEVGNVKDAKVEKPVSLKKEVKHEEVSKAEEDTPEIKTIKDKIVSMENLNKEGLLTNEGLNQAREQLEAQIETLRKK